MFQGCNNDLDPGFNLFTTRGSNEKQDAQVLEVNSALESAGKKRDQKPSPDDGQARRLLFALVRREVESRYRGSVLGIGWSMITPLLMLGVYTFVFGVVFRSRWVGADEAASPAEFAVILFLGLILYQILAETLARAPNVVLSNVSYVKKVVFPLQILVPVALGSALIHACISLVVLIPFLFQIFGGIPWTVVFLPLIVLPLCLMTLGLGWFLASVGTYARDVGQIVGPLITALLFLAPIFFPTSALPAWLQPWIALNPISLPVEEARKAMIFGIMPDFGALWVYACWSLVISAAGYLWFQKTRKGFADVV